MYDIMKKKLTKELLAEAIAEHPIKDIPFTTVQLGEAWASVMEGIEHCCGVVVHCVPWRMDNEVYLVSAQQHGFHEEEVSLSPSRVRNVESMFRSGAVAVKPSGASHQWWSIAHLTFVTEELRHELCDYVGDGSEHGQLDLRNGVSVQMHDWDLTVVAFERTNPQKDLAALLHEYYGMPIDTSGIQTVIDRNKKESEILEERKKRYGQTTTN